MSDMTDKDKMIAYLISQVKELSDDLKESNKKIIELSDKINSAPVAPVQQEAALSMTQIQAMMQNAALKPVDSKLEKDMKKAIDLIVEHKDIWGF